ncbi:hypothetical protein [Chitinimonas sp. BJYL2]|uniref:hypothetical protein n=1 Tax=Chitinimonas sp. BJYL2 TaxID=2976696 RepID=UPI0022B4050A|nr:hypothetical protein [Chitinimonas sp. BJYL2]
MSVELCNVQGEKFRFSTIGWAFYLNLAAIYYGWDKVGTLPPKEWGETDGNWEGAYDWNAGQIVAQQDSFNLSVALESYLADPNGKVTAKELATGLSEAIGIEVSADENDDEYIASFIKFARLGDFQIW